MAPRELDVVVFGATGDTGLVGSCYLYFNARKLGVSSWAPAARNLNKLEEVLLSKLRGSEPGADGLAPKEAIKADSGDYESLLAMCKRARCVIACAGPFSEFGEGVVRACVEAGTHYVDITGEVPWVERMQQKYGEEAEKRGVCIVNFGGYDSVPPDLSTFLAAKALEAEGETLGRFEAFVGGMGGAIPSGTVNTVLRGVEQSKSAALNTVTFGLLGEPARAAVTDEPSKSYVPQTEQDNLSSNLFWTMVPGYSKPAGQFCFAHFMAPINAHSVHRTAVQEGYAGLEYRERMGGVPSNVLTLWGLGPLLGGMGAAAASGMMLMLPYATTVTYKMRDLINTPLQQRVRRLAVAGYQPTGSTSVRGHGVSRSGNMTAKVEIDSDYDPGLGFTMLSACTIASQILKQASPRAGFNTPVVALRGQVLAEALGEMGVRINVSTERV